jgi:two-component system sensor histidine kinase VicK
MVTGERRTAEASLTVRAIAYGTGIELPYALLVAIAYLRLLSIEEARDRRLVLALVGTIHVVKTGLVISLLVRMLRPIEEWQAAMRERGGPSDEVVRRAGRAAYETPLRFAVTWAVLWAFAYLPVTALLQIISPKTVAPGPQAMIATGLLSIACFAASLPLAYSIVAKLLLPVSGRISLVARERGVELGGRSFSLVSRLVFLTLFLAVAPTSLMAALVLSPAVGPVSQGVSVTLALFALVAIAWAPVCAGFLAGVVAGPFRRVGGAIEHIIDRGDVDKLERLPIHFKDEIGDLAEGVNSMVDRLQETSARIQAYVAERERLLEDAAQQAAQQKAVLDNIVEGVFACDAEGHLTLVNPSGTRMLRLPEGVGPRHVREIARLVSIHHEDGRAFSPEEQPLARALAGETVVQEEQVIADPERHRDLHLRTSAAPIRNEGGAVLGAVAVARDVTDVIQLEQVKDQFIRVAAHELKTPVAIMKGYALALLRGADDLPPARRSLLEAVARGADRMGRIVDDILAVSQAVLDMPKPTSERLDLRRLVEDGIAAVPAPSRSRIRLASAPDELFVRGDAERLRQVLGSLLDNAVKYSPGGGGIDVELAVTEVDDRGSARLAGSRPDPSELAGEDGPAAPPRLAAQVSVHDRGVGIPADKQGRIFELFFRAHTDTPHDYGGMGVGLYLAKDMIARQGGRMWFESDENSGTTFHFTVPLERA